MWEYVGISDDKELNELWEGENNGPSFELLLEWARIGGYTFHICFCYTLIKSIVCYFFF